MRTAFVFPGQGSQHVGMGAQARAQWPQIRRLFTEIETLTGCDLLKVMDAGPESALTDTVHSQLAVFGLSTALQQVLQAHGYRPQVVAGHSLGEFSALVCGGWLDFESAVVTVAQRALAMSHACASTPGAMLAILGVSLEGVSSSIPEGIYVANDNAPGQVVVSGAVPAIEAFERSLADAPVGRIVRLPVAGAFHSPLMQSAQDQLAPLIEGLPLRIGEIPLVSSATGQFVTDVDAYRQILLGQMTAPVSWVDVTRRLLSEVDDFVEIGPGSVLRGLIRKCDRTRVVRSCRDAPDLREMGLLPAQYPLAAA